MSEREKLVKRLGELFPGKSFCLHEQVWWHDGLDHKAMPMTSYTLSVLPGLEGKTCSQWQHESYLVCVARFREAVQKKDRAEMDQQQKCIDEELTAPTDALDI